MNKPQEISKESLLKVTGISDDELLQVIKDGAILPARKGMLDAAKTLIGLIKYYREKIVIQKHGRMPIDALLAMLNESGYKISRRYFYLMIQEGKLPKPEKNSFDLAEVSIALAVHQQALSNADPVKAKRAALLDRQIAAADRAALKDSQELISRNDAAQKLATHDEFLKNLLNFKLCDQLPALNAGLDAAAQRKNCMEILDDICRKMQAFCKEWKPMPIK